MMPYNEDIISYNIHFKLPNTDGLQQVEDYVSGGT